jgi:hypothetical protein
LQQACGPAQSLGAQACANATGVRPVAWL